MLRQNPLFAAAASEGWFWWLTPATTLRFVHAVPRPLAAPRFMVLNPVRVADSTSVTLVSGVDTHAPSTERLDIEAMWDEWVDDVSKPAPQRLEGVTAAVGHTAVAADEEIVVLAGAEQDVPLPGGVTVHLHQGVHHLGDTKHRMIDYRLRGATRFREYFDPRLFTSIDDSSVLGPAHRTNVLSSSRPAKPIVRDLIPLLLWHQETEADQPFALSRTRRGGVRVYLDRPWFTTGDGELLAVVLQRDTAATTGVELSQWGADPVFDQTGPAERADLPLSDLFHTAGLDDRPEPARPLGKAATETLGDLPGQPTVTLLGYRPEFSPERGQWFVDIALDPGSAFWPFVRLTVARWQPNSLPGRTLSPLVKCDFVQVLPQRTALLSRPDAGNVRVVVTGPVGVPRFARAVDREQDFVGAVQRSRVMQARLEQRDPSVPTDLGWQTVTAAVLPIFGVDGTTVSWGGELPLATALPPRRPGENTDWRVVVEEWEVLPADPALGPPTIVRTPRFGARVVYADQLPL